MKVLAEGAAALVLLPVLVAPRMIPVLLVPAIEVAAASEIPALTVGPMALRLLWGFVLVEMRNILLALFVLVEANVWILWLLLATELLRSVIRGLRWVLAALWAVGRQVVIVLARGAHDCSR